MAQIEAGELNRAAEEARRLASEANARASRANKDAEKEHMARVELVKSMQWRTLSKEQKEALCGSLSPGFIPYPAFQSGDIEGFQYAIQFAKTLSGCRNGHAGKENKDAKPAGEGLGSYPVPVEGVWLGAAKADPRLLASINRLLKGLRSSGVRVEGLDRTRGAGEILVGHMPLPAVEALTLTENDASSNSSNAP
jgi:hypothetical protein